MDQNQTEDEAFLKALQSIDLFMQQNGHNIDEFNLVSFKVGATREEMFAREYEDERTIQVSHNDIQSINQLNDRQQEAFDRITTSLNMENGGFFFIDGPGGTGKTYLYRALLASVRSKGDIALAVASSRVATSLLPGGRTAHSRFKLPTKIDDSMTCSISKQSVHARLILASKLIIWDEASMAHRRTIETLDLLLRDLTEKDILFGGKTIVFGGDFRQTIPIVVRGTKQDQIDACFVRLDLWQQVEKIRLVENMRARHDPIFMDFLLRVGNGTQELVSGDKICLPNHMCISNQDPEEPLDELITSVFPSFDRYFTDPFSIMDRAMLAPKNDCVHEINEALIERFPGQVVEYFSTDQTNDPTLQCQYQDFLNNTDVTGLPPHILRLKLNCPTILLRNINPSEGLCNGTRLIIRQLGKNIIGVQIASGENKGAHVFIPRIPLQTSDKIMCPILFKRNQFPVRLCFAMIINKAQGQTLDRVGIYLPEPVFTHGQLYVALSRVKRSDSIKVYIKPPTTECTMPCHTKNVVYKEILQDCLS